MIPQYRTGEPEEIPLPEKPAPDTYIQIVERDQKVMELRKKGMFAKDIAAKVGIAEKTVYRIFKRKGKTPPPAAYNLAKNTEGEGEFYDEPALIKPSEIQTIKPRKPLPVIPANTGEGRVLNRSF